MKKYKIVSIIFIFFTNLCFGQDGFRKTLPIEELRLDTPFSMTTYKDFLIINFSRDSINGDTIYSCKVNEQGKELYCVQKSTDQFSIEFLRKSNYNDKGDLQSMQLYYSPNQYGFSFVTHNEKRQKTKIEMFEFGKHWDLKDGIIPDSLKQFPLDSTNQVKLLNDNNYDINYRWKQSNLWTWKYDELGREIEFCHTDGANQKNRTITVYDTKGEIVKVLRYRNFLPYKKGDKEITDSLTLISEYQYFNDGYIRSTKVWDGYFYNYIDTFIVNNNDQIVKKISWWEHTNNDAPISDTIPLTHIESRKYEYDAYGRKTKRTIETQYNKKVELFIYRNKFVNDLINEEF